MIYLPVIIIFTFLAMTLVWARYARPLDRIPHCRKCDYNLSGIEPTPDKCPECGATLDLPGAIRIGRRLGTRKKIFVLNSSILCIALLLSGGLWLGGTTQLSKRPAWWLRMDLQSASAGRRSNAFDEMLDRLIGGTLEDSDRIAFANIVIDWTDDLSMQWHDDWAIVLDEAFQVPECRIRAATVLDDIADDVLLRQADHQKTWDNGWGSRFEYAAGRELTTDDQVETYLRQATSVSHELVVPARLHNVHMQAPIFLIRNTGHRMSSNPQAFIDAISTDGMIMMEARITEDRIDGETIQNGTARMTGPLLHTNVRRMIDVPALSVGPHTAEIDVTYSIIRQAQNPTRRFTSAGDNVESLAQWDTTVRASFEIVPDDVSLVTSSSDLQAAELIKQRTHYSLQTRHGQRSLEEYINQRRRNALKGVREQLSRDDLMAIHNRDKTVSTWRELIFVVMRTDQQLAHRITLQKDGRSEHVGELVNTELNHASSMNHIRWPAESWVNECATVDVVLTYDEELAAASGIGHFLNNEIRYEDVYVGGPPEDRELTPERKIRLDQAIVPAVQSCTIAGKKMSLNLNIGTNPDGVDWTLELYLESNGTEHFIDSFHFGDPTQQATGGGRMVNATTRSMHVPAPLQDGGDMSVTFILRTPREFGLGYEHRLPAVDLRPLLEESNAQRAGAGSSDQ